MNRTTALRRVLLAGAATVTVLALAACGGDGDDMGGMNHGASASAPPASAAAPASVSGVFNDADVLFAQMMIPHHEQAVVMADLAPAQATDPEVKQLATKIKAAQDPEIRTLKGWLSAWGKPTVPPSMPAAGHGGHTSTSGMPGMMSDAEMSQLKAAKGVEFDRMFARMMIAHHEGAIQMAKDEQAKGVNPQAKELAVAIEKSQAAEVEQLRKIVNRL